MATQTTSKPKAPAKKRARKKATAKQTIPARKGSLAEFMDTVVQKETDAQQLKAKLEAEAKKLGVQDPGLSGLRAHVRFRQARGKLTDVNINW